MVPFLTVKQKILVPGGGCPGSVSEAFNHLQWAPCGREVGPVSGGGSACAPLIKVTGLRAACQEESRPVHHFQMPSFKKLIYFNWRLITVLYWFCHILTWISHACTCVPILNPPLPPPSPSHPSGSSQCTGPGCPVSCIEPRLAICFTYGNIHVSVPFSQITHPLSESFSHRVQESALYLCVSKDAFFT